MQIVSGFVLVAIVAVGLWVLLGKQMREWRTWRATATPLASIIGSGFLVVAPLLAVTVGAWAPVAMLGIVLLAYGIGAVIRYQIRYAEPLLEGAKSGVLLQIERVSGLALAVAYVVSVAFYVRLLASFAMRPFHLAAPVIYEQVLTTLILGFIGGWGAWRGLRSLESLEDIAVGVKLSIIAALLVALAVFDGLGAFSGSIQMPTSVIADPVRAARVLAGLLLVVQGFETSRYLGAEYDPELRIRTMAASQWLTGVIYVGFVALCVPLMVELSGPPDETAIIGMTAEVHPVLPVLLVVAALMSQFSAAVADTLGGGGLLHQLTGGRVKEGYGYLLLVGLAIALVWFADIFQVISLASRAFASYYLLQAVSALLIANRRCERGHAVAFGLLAALLGMVVIFAVPAG